MRNPDWPIIAVVGFAVGMITMTITDSITGFARADEHRFQNICVWQGGHVVDDICVSGKVVIGKKTDDSDFKAVK